MKQTLLSIPLLGPTLRNVRRALPRRSKPFPGSEKFWDQRYEEGGNSGRGSYNELAAFKAEVLNDFVASRQIGSVIEFGCGDGNQLTLANYPSYVGVDVSPQAISICRGKFERDATKSFELMSDYAGKTAELALSLDVVYHLIEDDVYDLYMHRLFDAATAHVVVYASNTEEQDLDRAAHVRHRRFTDWVVQHRSDWRLVSHIPNRYPYKGPDRLGSFADFYFFEPTNTAV